MKGALLFVVLLCLVKLPLSAQSVFTFIKTDWDTNYIDKFATHWSGRLYAVSKNQFFSITNRTSHEVVSFHPNSKAAIGLGISYGNYAIDLGVNISNRKADSLQSTKSFDLQSGIYTGQHVFDLSFQWYAGFFSSFQGPQADTSTVLFRNDIRTFNVGINYTYNFNYRRFSFNAPFIGTQIQKKSAGSPLAGVFVTYYDLRGNKSIIPAAASNEFDEAAEISEANLLTAGLIGGYAYTFVLPEHFTITLSLIPGLSFNIGDLKTSSYYNIGHPVTVSPKIVSKSAVGYEGKKFYSFLSYAIDGNFVNLGNKNQLNYNLSKFKFLVGYRIK